MATRKKWITPIRVSVLSVIIAAGVWLSKPVYTIAGGLFKDEVSKIVREETKETTKAIKEVWLYTKLQASLDSVSLANWEKTESIVENELFKETKK